LIDVARLVVGWRFASDCDLLRERCEFRPHLLFPVL